MRASGLPIVANKLSELTGYFKSSNQTFALDTLLPVAHGLGARPDWAAVSLICIATDNNFAVDDEVTMPSNDHSGADGGVTIFMDATNVNIVTGATVAILDQTTFNTIGITASKWKLVVRAWL
jgi:hypothetical protein